MDPCYTYRDSLVVQGTLEPLTFPGPPNYTSFADGDEAEAGFYLRLQDPLCVLPVPGQDSGSDASVAPRREVRLLQLVLDSAGYETFRPFIGQWVAAIGTLFSSHTGHHHAPLLMQSPRIIVPTSPGRAP